MRLTVTWFRKLPQAFIIHLRSPLKEKLNKDNFHERKLLVFSMFKFMYGS